MNTFLFLFLSSQKAKNCPYKESLRLHSNCLDDYNTSEYIQYTQ